MWVGMDSRRGQARGVEKGEEGCQQKPIRIGSVALSFRVFVCQGGYELQQWKSIRVGHQGSDQSSGGWARAETMQSACFRNPNRDGADPQIHVHTALASPIMCPQTQRQRNIQEHCWGGGGGIEMDNLAKRCRQKYNEN